MSNLNNNGQFALISFFNQIKLFYYEEINFISNDAYRLWSSILSGRHIRPR